METIGGGRRRREEAGGKEERVSTKERKQREMLAVDIDMFCQQLLPGRKRELFMIFYTVCVCVAESEWVRPM